MLRRRSEALQLSKYGRSSTSVAFGDTIANVPQAVPLRSLCLEEGDTVQPQAAPVQELFKIRLADNQGRREAAGLLVRRRYAWRGYHIGTLHGVNPNRITLSACNRDEVVATIAVGLDTETGLFVDQLYRSEVDRIRSDGRKVCEFTKLAVEASVRSKPILAALFHIAYIHARRINLCSDLVVEVNPRHVTFYERMLGFSACGPEKMDPRVGAAAVLLRLDLAFAERQIAEMGGHPEFARTRHSLYPYFFAAHEEIAIERRLRTVR
jgi:N-acyl amino acid synthase FeeM